MTKLNISICAVLAIASVYGGAANAATTPWSHEQDSDLGFRFSYPRSLFTQIEGDSKPAFHYFVSPNSDAKFMVGAWNNREGRTPDQFKRWLMANAGGYDELTYRPRGRSWFVLSGYRGDDIYYEKVMFSCGGQVVNVMAITYPSGEIFTIRRWSGWKIILGRHDRVLRSSVTCLGAPQIRSASLLFALRVRSADSQTFRLEF